MNIKIFTEAGKNIGLGHISRCSALYNEAINQGHTVDFYVYSDLENIKLLDKIEHIKTKWLDIDYLKSQVRKDDYCIIDSYLADKKILEFISNNSKNTIFIDDNNRIKYPKGIVINPSLNIGEIKYPNNTETTYYWGKDYVILRNAFKNAKRKEINKKVSKVLIIMGGADIKNLTPLIIDTICRKNTDINFDIVISSNSKLFENKEYQKYKNIDFYHSLDDTEIKKLMLDADFAISAAGQTIYELISTSTPFIPIKIAENQNSNINSLIENKIIIDYINYDDRNFIGKIENNFNNLLDYNTRHSLFLNSQDIIDARGAERIIKRLN